MSMFAMGGSRFSDGFENRHAHQAERNSQKRHKTSELDRHTRWLEANLAKCLMINEALWEIIRDKLNLTENDLNDKLYQIDMRDGRLDGKNQRPATKCPQCSRTVSARHLACLYCGHVMDDSVFNLS